jgi:hypothetical protein
MAHPSVLVKASGEAEWVGESQPPPLHLHKLSIEGLGFRVQGSESRVQSPGFKVQGSRFRIKGKGFRWKTALHSFGLRV